MGNRRLRDELVIVSAREELFAQAVVNGLSQTMAAIQAGAKPTSASSVGTQMAQRAHVAARILELKQQRDTVRTAVVAKIEMAQREGVLIDLIETREMAKNQGNLAARLKANELIGREIGMFVTKIDATVTSPLDGLSRDTLLALASVLDGRLIAGNVVEVPNIAQPLVQLAVGDETEDLDVDPLS